MIFTVNPVKIRSWTENLRYVMADAVKVPRTPAAKARNIVIGDDHRI